MQAAFPESTRRRLHVVFCLLLSAMGAWSVAQPNAPGHSRWDEAAAGVLGMVFAVAAMGGQRALKWVTGWGLLSATVVAWIGFMSPVGAGDANEFVVGIAWFACSVLMMLAGLASSASSFLGRTNEGE